MKKRFITEYANYTKNTINNNTLIKQEYKNIALDRIERALKFVDKGYITIDEAIKSILFCFEGIEK